MVTQNRLRQLFIYDEDSGNFIRRIKTGKSTKVGEIAGGKMSSGYIRLRVDGKKYLAHRLAWLYVYGEMPKMIDHINHDTSDNRISNLRNVTHKNNHRNRKQHCNNKSGRVGVYWDSVGRKWISTICVDGRSIHLGRFIEFHEAVNARKNAEVLYGFHENHGKE